MVQTVTPKMINDVTPDRPRAFEILDDLEQEFIRLYKIEGEARGTKRQLKDLLKELKGED